MKIISLRLENYHRLILNNVKVFEYTPKRSKQIILGTNGSGKSSIMNELSPLPADASDYLKGGSKTVVISHRGSLYTLSSNFKHGSKHSFIKDDEEMNPGSTLTVQKELVEREFGYTSEIHDILTGRLSFTAAPQAKRREWITSLSSADYTFALGLYKRLQTATRDHLGAVRQLKSQLVEETSKLNALPDSTGWEDQIDKLQAELNALLSERQPGLASGSELSRALEDHLAELRRMSSKIQTFQEAGLHRFGDRNQLTELRMETETQLNTQLTLRDRYGQEFNELESLVGKFTGDDEVDLDNLESSIVEVEANLSVLKTQVRHFLDIPSADYAYTDTVNQLTDIELILNEIPENTDLRISSETITKNQDALSWTLARQEECRNKITRLSAEITVMETAREQTCPKCTYVWREGYSQEKMDELLRHKQHVEGLLSGFKDVEAEKRKFAEEASDYTAAFSKFRGMANGYPRLKPLWMALNEGPIFGWPSDRQVVLSRWVDDVTTQSQIVELERRLEEMRKLAARQKMASSERHLKTRAEEVRKLMQEATESIGELKQKVTEYRTLERTADELQVTTQTLGRINSKINALMHDQVAALRNDVIDRSVREFQTALGSYRHMLAERRTMEGVVGDLDRRVTDLEERYRTLALLTKSISPTEGLIAEQLSGFIKTLVAQMNSVIASIWEYDMAVLPCGMENGDLDYKFPLQVVSGKPPRADVKDGSTAMVELVNFAFRMTVMLYKGFSDYPLYLDEFSSGMDERHRVNAMAFVKQLMDSDRHSQMFFISHYAANHGGFSDAEFVVTDAANVAVPVEYNTQVKFK